MDAALREFRKLERLMPKFEAVEEEDIWTVYCGTEVVGRALSKRDADQFVDYLNGSHVTNIRQKILDDVADAIEDAFEQLGT